MSEIRPKSHAESTVRLQAAVGLVARGSAEEDEEEEEEDEKKDEEEHDEEDENDGYSE